MQSKDIAYQQNYNCKCIPDISEYLINFQTIKNTFWQVIKYCKYLHEIYEITFNKLTNALTTILRQNIYKIILSY